MGVFPPSQTRMSGAALGLFLPLRQPVLLVGPRSPIQLPACGQAQDAPSARQVPRAARSLRPWLRGTSHVVPLLSSWGCPAPSSKPWLGGLAPCSLLPLELRPPGMCRPPGSLRAPVGALATHTARSLGPALLPTLDSCLVHGGCTAVLLVPTCPESCGHTGQCWGPPGSCQLKADTAAAVFPGRAFWRRIALGFCKLSFNVLKVPMHKV